MKRVIGISTATIMLCMITAMTFGQVLDGAFARQTTARRSVVPLPELREENAMLSKKVLRVLELREKQNHPLYFPITRMTFPGELQPQRSRVNLLYLVYNIGVLGETYDKATGNVMEDTAEYYDNRYPVYKLSPSDITSWWKEPLEKDDPTRSELLAYFEEINETDPFTGEMYSTTIPAQLQDTREMDQLWIWEEWVFDKERSVMDVRIIAMSPDGWHDGKRIWPFWIPYRDYRPLFATHETFNSHNEAEHRTFDDIFLKRKFTSYIVAETNNYDNRLISDYLLGIDAIREGERIQQEIAKFEHDLWEF